MKRLAATLVSLSMAVSAFAQTDLTIARSGSQPSRQGPAENFTGRVQRWGGPVEETRPGDVVLIPPGLKHWHGAAPDSSMTHIAIQEQQDGKTVDWLEKVSDAQYGCPQAPC